MPVAITLGDERVIKLEEDDNLYVIKEWRGQTDVKVLLCKNTKREIDEIIKYMYQMRVFAVDDY